ncbi:MAG: YebC/PmpR family DNA-binding transcriptional regulator [Candidatus Paceibacterota bacterium]|jgi:transcriptional/translational regulatory protein YebC/TACO1
MSHSQWEKKKYKKASSEGKTSKLYTKLVRLIMTEAKKANGNRESSELKAAIQKARDASMPSDNIERAIKKATESNEVMEQITYEAYGPSGVGIVIEALTTNRNKAAAEIKHILSLHETSLAGIGSVTWGFKKSGNEWTPNMTVPLSPEDSEKIEKLIDALEDNDEVQEVFTNAE